MVGTRMLDLNPLKGCSLPRLERTYCNILSETFWKSYGHDLAADIYDHGQQVKEAVLALLKKDLAASVAYSGKGGVFYSSGGVDFPFLDTELNESVTLRVCPTYEYDEHEHEIRVTHRVYMLGGKEVVLLNASVYLSYNPKVFMGIYRDLRTVIGLVECWRVPGGNSSHA